MTAPTRVRKWTTQQAADASGATYRRIDYWFRCGLLGTDTASGSGSTRLLTHEQVQRIQLIAAASDAGLNLSRIALAHSSEPYDPDRTEMGVWVTRQVVVCIRIDPIQ